MFITPRPVLRAIVFSTAAMLGAGWPAAFLAQAPAAGASPIVGAWTMNKSLTTTTRGGDAPPEERGRAGGGGRRGGGGRGGGGGFSGGGLGGPSVFGDRDADASARLRDAIRDITDPPDHLTIVTTETMVIITGTPQRCANQAALPA